MSDLASLLCFLFQHKFSFYVGSVLVLLFCLLIRLYCRAGFALLEPVHVGHVQTRGSPDQHISVQTLSVNPPIFLLRGFLDSADADSLLQLAKSKDHEWKQSYDSGGDVEAWRELKRGGLHARRILASYDFDGDGALNATESTAFAARMYHLPNHDHSVFAQYVFRSMNSSVKNKSVPLDVAAGADVAKYLLAVARSQPYRLTRFSEQTWLNHSSALLQMLLKRIGIATGLSEKVIAESEELQVLHYPQRGHYACHHDSVDFCGGSIRFATLTLYLNDVARGGETVFPGALREESFNWTRNDWDNLKRQCQPTSACTQLGGLVVKPKKGDAIFWYNTRVSALDSLARGICTEDHLERATLHCGAEVLEGEKWMANLWLRVDA